MSDSPAPHPAPEQRIRRLLDSHERRLMGYVLRLLGDADEARDTVQEAFLRLCRQDARVLDRRAVPWLFRVCRNLAIDRLRAAGRQGEVTALDFNHREGEAPQPLDHLLVVEQERDLARLVAALPARQQEVVRLKFLDGFAYREIAEITGTSIGNVGHVLHTALKSLRRAATATPTLHPTS